VGQPDNVNSIKHGQRSTRNRFGLVHRKLGQRFASAYGHCCQLRRAVERQVSDAQGSITLQQQALIQTLLRAEESCAAAEKLISENPQLTAEEIRLQRDAIMRWSQQRDNLLAKLLDGKREAMGSVADLYAQPPQTQPGDDMNDDEGKDDPEATDGTADATAATAAIKETPR
jgi:hypothetical protein